MIAIKYIREENTPTKIFCEIFKFLLYDLRVTKGFRHYFVLWYPSANELSRLTIIDCYDFLLTISIFFKSVVSNVNFSVTEIRGRSNFNCLKNKFLYLCYTGQFKEAFSRNPDTIQRELLFSLYKTYNLEFFVGTRSVTRYAFAPQFSGKVFNLHLFESSSPWKRDRLLLKSKLLLHMFAWCRSKKREESDLQI